MSAFKAYISTKLKGCFVPKVPQVRGAGLRLVWRVHLVDQIKDLLLHQAAGAAAKHLELDVEDGREHGQQSAQDDLPARMSGQGGGGEPELRLEQAGNQWSRSQQETCYAEQRVRCTLSVGLRLPANLLDFFMPAHLSLNLGKQ